MEAKAITLTRGLREQFDMLVRKIDNLPLVIQHGKAIRDIITLLNGELTRNIHQFPDKASSISDAISALDNFLTLFGKEGDTRSPEERKNTLPTLETHLQNVEAAVTAAFSA